MKFLEKHGLLKLVSITLLIAIILTWLSPIASFSAGELVTEEFSRVGIFDITTFGLLGFNYFPFIFVFLFIVGAFYGYLAKLDAYQELTNKIAKKFEDKAFVFTVVSMVVYGILASIVVDYVVLFALVPLTLTVASKIKSTKLSAFIATFGGILLGILGSTLNGNVSSSIQSTFSTSYGAPESLAILIVFVIGAVILGYLAHEDLKINGSKEEKLAKDLFAEVKEEEVKEDKGIKKLAKKVVKKIAVKKINTVPLTIVYCITIVLSILAFINWENIGVSLFADINTYLTDATIAGVPVYSYILGSTITAFGSWSLFGVCALLLIAMIIISIIYKVSFNNMVDSLSEGLKNVGKIVGIVFIIYIVLETTYFFPVLPVIVNAIYELFGNNIVTWLIAPALQTVFSVEFQYVMQGVGELLKSIGSETLNVTSLASQFAYGLVSFVAPTSVMLAAGLTMIDINIKEYFKFIWKFLVAMLVVIVIVLLILLLI